MIASKIYSRPVALLGMVAPGVEFRGVTPFCSKIGEDQKKKSLPWKKWVFGSEICEFQNKKKKKVFAAKMVGFQFKCGRKKRSSLQISEDVVSIHNMVSPQNGDTRPPLPSDATATDYGTCRYQTHSKSYFWIIAKLDSTKIKTNQWKLYIVISFCDLFLITCGLNFCFRPTRKGTRFLVTTNISQKVYLVASV